MSIQYGGDYNPEQWDPETWDQDIELMLAAGVNLVTIGVFSWSKLEPREGVYDFGWLDAVVERLFQAGIGIDLATATASPPPWLTTAHPEVLPVMEDGRVLSPGSRQHYCPSSPVFRDYALRMVGALVSRYADHPGIIMWHVNNELGASVPRCYCDVSAGAFREWLERKYGSVDVLNEAWGATFWSQNYASFGEVLPPRSAPYFKNPGQQLDFDRFSSDELLACYRAEAAIIRQSSSDGLITTNFMGAFKGADYWEWAPHVDIVSDDLYPDPHDRDGAAAAAMCRDLMRSLKRGAPWMLMEQSTSAMSWLPVNARKPPAQMRALSYQAVARGSNSVMFFQWRQSDRGAERFLTGMLPHSGTDTGVWRAVRDLGLELGGLEGLSDLRVSAKVAIVFDWPSWWSLEQDANPAQLDYLHEIGEWHRTLVDMGIAVDFIPVGLNPQEYDVVIVPTLFCASDASLEVLVDYVSGGGELVVTYMSGTTDETARVRQGGYLGPLSEALGLSIDEFAPMPIVEGARFATTASVSGAEVGTGRGRLWAEVLRREGASTIACFDDGELAGAPAITSHRHGEGTGWYVGTSLDRSLRRRVLKLAGLEPRIVRCSPADALVEVVDRGGHEFLISHHETVSEVTIVIDQEMEPLEVTLPAFGVLVRRPGEIAFCQVSGRPTLS